MPSHDPSAFEIMPEFASQFVRDTVPTPPPHLVARYEQLRAEVAAAKSAESQPEPEYEPGVYLHVHTSQADTGFDPTCEGCQKIETARRQPQPAPYVCPQHGVTGETADEHAVTHGADLVDVTVGPHAARKAPPQWHVTDPYARTEHTFEDLASLLLYAVEVARIDRPTVITDEVGDRYVVMREDPRVTLQAVRYITGPDSGRPVPPAEPAESSVQALAGARLFYCLYHDVEAVKWLTGRGDPGKGRAFMKAYMSAQAAFLPPEMRRRGIVEDDNPYRFESQHEAIRPEDAARLVQQGRREAAEAIRRQAAHFAVKHADLATFETAAQVAEGSTGVQDGDRS